MRRRVIACALMMSLPLTWIRSSATTIRVTIYKLECKQSIVIASRKIREFWYLIETTDLIIINLCRVRFMLFSSYSTTTTTPGTGSTSYITEWYTGSDVTIGCAIVTPGSRISISTSGWTSNNSCTSYARGTTVRLVHRYTWKREKEWCEFFIIAC